MLTPERKTRLDQLFNPEVIKSLAKRGIHLDTTKQRNYIDQIEYTYERSANSITYGRMKKSRPDREYTLIFLDDEPCLLRPTPLPWKIANQQGKRLSNAIPKSAISLVTGEMKFIKTWRAKNRNDTYPQTYSQLEHDAYKEFGIKTIRAVRQTETGIKCYVNLPFYEGENLDVLNTLPATTPSHLLSALIQACRQLMEWHKKDLIHRDFKPGNIMFDPDTQSAHLVDYETRAKANTISSTIYGTRNYAHPRIAHTINVLKKPVEYTKGDDVYTVLVVAATVLTWIQKKEENKRCKSLFVHYHSIIEDMSTDTGKNPPQPRLPQDMPLLSEVLETLERLERHYQLLAQRTNDPPAHEEVQRAQESGLSGMSP